MRKKHRLLSLILAGSFAVMSCPIDAAAKYEAITFPRGDVNMDHEVTLEDYNLVTRHVEGIEKMPTIYQALADVDNNGKIDWDDAELISRIALGLFDPKTEPLPLVNEPPEHWDTPVSGVSGNLKYNNYNDYVTITGWTGEGSTDIVIPSEIDGVPVKNIGAEAFRETPITSVIMPDSIDALEYNYEHVGATFYNCSSLKKVVLSNSLTYIPTYSFLNCTALTDCELPEGLSSIGYAAFENVGLTTVRLPSTLYSMDLYCFSYCVNLQSYEVAEGNKTYFSVDGMLFSKSGGRTCLESFPSGRAGSVTLDRNVVLNPDAFRGCRKVTSIKYPNTQWICATNDCDSLTELLVYDDNPYYTSKGGCLYSKSGKTLMQVPDGFSGELVIGDDVTAIGEFAVSACDKITSVTLPESVTQIYFGAFADMPNLKSITIQNPYCIIDEGSATISNSVTYEQYSTTEANAYYIYGKTMDGVIKGYDGSTAEAYANKHSYAFSSLGKSAYAGEVPEPVEQETLPAEQEIPTEPPTEPTEPTGPAIISSGHSSYTDWKLTDDGVLTISGKGKTNDYSSSFDWDWQKYKNDIREVVIEEGVTYLGKYAFYQFPNLERVTMPSVETIGECAFYNCAALKEIVFSDALQSMNSNAVYGTAWLDLQKEIDPLVTAGNVLISAEGCTGDVVIPNGIKEIPARTFARNTEITSVIIPDSVTSIGEEAFHGCNALKSVSIPEGIRYLNANLFNGCYALEEIKIPNSVVCIDHDAFSYCRMLTSVSIPDGVTYIGNSAFEYCDMLTSVNIPDSVSFIGDRAFEECRALTEVVLPENLMEIKDNTFHNCIALTTINMPESLSSIGSGAFDYCRNLTSVSIPEGVTSIGEEAFYGCSLSELTLPESLESIDKGAFRYCTELKSVTLPENLTSIGAACFSNCTHLVEITLPKHLESIGSSAFSECSSLREISIPESVTVIASSAFNSCNSLETITLPEGLTSIGDNAFANCISLKTVSFPETIKSIGPAAFRDCSSLASVTLPDGFTNFYNDTFAGTPWLDNQKDESPFLIVNGALLRYSGEDAEVVIPDGVTSIARYAFYSCDSITSLTIPEGVISIGSEAFYNCTNLSVINLPMSVADIANNAFDKTPWLTAKLEENPYLVVNNVLLSVPDSGDVVIPDGVTSIACIIGKDITSVTLPEGVTTISDSMFSGCKNLTSVKLPSSMTNIGKGAFCDCTSLTEIIIPDGVTRIEDEAFQNCAFLTKADLPAGLTSIGDNAFAHCESLSECTIPESVTSIGASAFTFTGITSAVIPEGITDIGSMTFYNCTALESVTIPKSVVTIGRYAFNSCSSLTEITIPKSVVTIGEHAFEACSGLTSVTIEDGVEIIDDGAFYNCKGVTEFNFPASVRYIGKNALYGTSDGVTITILNPLCEINYSGNYYPYNAKIIGYTNSTAKYLASKNNLQFESCGENPGEEPSNLTGLGDLNADDTVNASDAAQILIAAAAIGAGRDAGLTEAQKTAADVNSDETINASDAAIVLIYAAAAGAGQDVKLTDFVK